MSIILMQNTSVSDGCLSEADGYHAEAPSKKEKWGAILLNDTADDNTKREQPIISYDFTKEWKKG